MSEVGSTPATPTSTPSAPMHVGPRSNQSSSREAPSTQTQTPTTPTKGTPPSSLNGQTPPPTPPSPGTDSTLREYKIDGKIVKMTQKEADDYVSMSYVAQQRLHEAGRLRKELEAREQNYQKEPLKAFLDYAEKAKLTPEQTRQALEDYYAKQYIEPETLTAEQRELRALQEFKKQTEQEKQQRELEHRKQFERKETDQHINNVTSEITSALDSAQLPQKNKFLVQRMAFYMLENNKNGYNAPKEMILKQVVNEHKGIVGDFLKDASMDQILSYAGQEFIDRVLKFSIEKIRGNRNKLQEPFSSDDNNAQRNMNGKVDYTEVNRRLRDMRTGKYVGSG